MKHAAVGVVLDGVHLGGDALLVALEVDDPVLALVAAPAEAAVTRPWLLRPPVFLSGRSSDFSGFVEVISA